MSELSNISTGRTYGSIRGPNVQLGDPNKATTERTPPQVSQQPLTDSRLMPRYYTLTERRIEELRRDATISFMRNIVVAPAIHTPWSFKEKEGAPAGAKDFIEQQVLPHRLHLIQNMFFSCLDYGYSPMEIVYQLTSDNKIGIDKFKLLFHEYTTIMIYMDTGDFAGYMNEPLTGTFTFIPQSYSLHCNFEHRGTDWYGIGKMPILSEVQDRWLDSDGAASRYDKKIAGAHWVCYYPVGRTIFNGVETDNHEIASTVISNIEASGGSVIPDEVVDWLTGDDIDREAKGKWRLELISPINATTNSFSDRLKYLDNLKVRAFDIPERAVLEGKFGTKAEAETHADIGLSTIDTKHRHVVQCINRQVINYLLATNYGPEAKDSVRIEVAPLTDAKFQSLREVYRMVLQNGDLAKREFAGIDTDILREELSIPSTGEDIDREFPTFEDMKENGLFNQNGRGDSVRDGEREEMGGRGEHGRFGEDSTEDSVGGQSGEGED